MLRQSSGATVKALSFKLQAREHELEESTLLMSIVNGVWRRGGHGNGVHVRVACCLLLVALRKGSKRQKEKDRRRR